MVDATQQSITRVSVIQAGSGPRATVISTAINLDVATIAAQSSRQIAETARTSTDAGQASDSIAQILNAGSRFRLILSVIQDLLQQTYHLRLRASDMAQAHFVQNPDNSYLFLETLTSTISRLETAIHNLSQRLNLDAFRSQDIFESLSIPGIDSSQAIVAIRDVTLTQRLAELSSNLLSLNNRLRVLDGHISVSNHTEDRRVNAPARSLSSERGSSPSLSEERSQIQGGHRTALSDSEQVQTDSTRTNGHFITRSALLAERSEYILRSSQAMIQDDRLRSSQPANLHDDIGNDRDTNLLNHVVHSASNANLTTDSGIRSEPDSRAVEITAPHQKLLPLVYELDKNGGHLSMAYGALYSSHVSIVHKPEMMFYKGIEYRNCFGLWLSYRGVEAPKHALYAQSSSDNTTAGAMRSIDDYS